MIIGCPKPRSAWSPLCLHGGYAGDHKAAAQRFPHFFNPTLPKPLVAEVRWPSLREQLSVQANCFTCSHCLAMLGACLHATQLGTGWWVLVSVHVQAKASMHIKLLSDYKWMTQVMCVTRCSTGGTWGAAVPSGHVVPLCGAAC